MASDVFWLADVLAGVRGELSSLCTRFGVLNVCLSVLESVAEVFPTWFSGRKKRVIAGSILYISLLIAKGAKKGFLRAALAECGASKPSVRDAVSALIHVGWGHGIVYLDPRLYEAIGKRISLPSHVRPYTVREVVRSRIEAFAPGLYNSLELSCRRASGKDCVSLMLSDPKTFIDVVTNSFRAQVVAKRILENFVAPVAKALSVKESPQKLVEVLLSNPEEFKRVLNSIAK